MNAYRNDTFVGNWFEDRFSQQQLSPTTKRYVNTNERVSMPDLATPEFLTVNQASSTASRATPRIVNVVKPSLYSTSNLTTCLANYTKQEPIPFALGLTAPRELANVPQRHMQTTKQLHYERMPELAVQAKPLYFAPNDTKHNINGQLSKPGGVDGSVSNHKHLAGGKGARGELTRRQVRDYLRPASCCCLLDCLVI